MAYGAFDPYAQQDEFTSSFFQSPQQPDAATAPDPARPQANASPSMAGFDGLTSSVFGGGAGATHGVFAPQKAAEFARRHAPADYGTSAASPQQPPSPSPDLGGVGPTSAGAGFDYGSLVNKVKTSAGPREQAIAKDQLARATYSQLKQAGHEVSWEGDNLVVDGRPYVIGDGASGQPAGQPAAGRPAAAAPSGKTAPTNGPSHDYYQQATGRTTGGAQSPQEAYDRLSARLDPNASREEMEAAIEEEFGHLPGYGGAYKESVMLNGRWYDMVTGYGGAGASWGGLTPKGPSQSAMLGSSGVMSGALSPFGGAGAGSGGMGGRGVEGARGVELSAGLNPSILAFLQQQQAPEPEPMTPSYMNLLR